MSWEHGGVKLEAKSSGKPKMKEENQVFKDNVDEHESAP
jgi:hypothetical protein